MLKHLVFVLHYDHLIYKFSELSLMFITFGFHVKGDTLLDLWILEWLWCSVIHSFSAPMCWQCEYGDVTTWILYVLLQSAFPCHTVVDIRAMHVCQSHLPPTSHLHSLTTDHNDSEERLALEYSTYYFFFGNTICTQPSCKSLGNTYTVLPCQFAHFNWKLRDSEYNHYITIYAFDRRIYLKWLNSALILSGAYVCS